MQYAGDRSAGVHDVLDPVESRSPGSSLTQLIVELRELGTLKFSDTTKTPDIKTVAEGTSQQIKTVLAHMPASNAFISYQDLNLYVLKLCGNMTDAEHPEAEADAELDSTYAEHEQPDASQWGYDVVDYERKNPELSSLLPYAVTPGVNGMLATTGDSPPEKNVI
jgi:hypothetical protein